MKIYDMHIHTRIGKPDPEDILKKNGGGRGVRRLPFLCSSSRD